MLSYMVPVEEKPPPAPVKGRLALELVGSPGSPESAVRKTRSNISKESSTSSFASDLTISSSTPTGVLDKPKHKLLSNGSKHTSLKRSDNFKQISIDPSNHPSKHSQFITLV
ncbi:hypothetical protein RR48_14141 [Papilio machaon]|uniref:Uncharacterized protein n=1 Tax=Papilio machaon TaxID=76193 RepID=A0A194QLJ2_PAPMA|nr:hypothetical protein RR48_14141 [Papilio machaon]